MARIPHMTQTRQLSDLPVWILASLILFGICVADGQEYGPMIDDVDSLRTALSSYVGAQTCATCHADEYEIWLGTPHARAWVFLSTPMAERIAADFKGGPVAEPTRSARCLRCHATAASVDPAYLGTEFHFEEGIQCEACHGPGGDHALDPENPTLGSELAATSIDGTTCSVCHRPPPSHTILNRAPFDRSKGLRRIDHAPSMSETPSAEKPRSWLGGFLRSLKGK